LSSDLGAPLAARLQQIRAQLPPGTELLAVSKGHTAGLIRQAVALGQRSFGESRLQEAQAKQAQLADLPPLDWHFIGRLQANKVRPVLRSFGTVHAIDSLALAQRVARIAAEENLAPQLFFQVKFLPDPSKGGFSPEALQQLWPQLRDLAPARPVGLMTITPLGLSPQQSREVFEACRALADACGLPGCSMGMSGDWQQAAAAGSTWVRIGSGLFGSRVPNSDLLNSSLLNGSLLNSSLRDSRPLAE
jgi:pyridoxal phosphate enzyme (YggS family)